MGCDDSICRLKDDFRDRFFALDDGTFLAADGDKVPVTSDNKKEYLQCLIDHYNTAGMDHQLKVMRNGLYNVIPRSRLAIFNPDELQVIYIRYDD